MMALNLVNRHSTPPRINTTIRGLRTIENRTRSYTSVYVMVIFLVFVAITSVSYKIKRFDITLPETFSGPLLANSWLSRAEHLFRDEIRGPESFAMRNGKIYTGLHDGRIVEVMADRLRTVAFLDPDNQGLAQCRRPSRMADGNCSRPLGIRFAANGSLYAVDPYHGIFRINVHDGQYQLILDVRRQKLPDGSVARFLDDLVLVEDEDQPDSMVIYMTDASQRWLLHQVFFTVGEHDDTGRLLSYNTATGQFKIVIANLKFPNGLTLTFDKTRILLNEFNQRRVLSFDLSTENLSVLVDQLPGEPDNIKPSLDGQTYWIGLFTGRNQHRHSFFLDTMANYSFIQNAFFLFIDQLGFWLQKLALLFKQNWLADIGFDIQNGNFLFDVVAEYGMAIEIDDRGRIISSLHSPDGRTSCLSEVFEYRPADTRPDDGHRYFYLGSYSNRFLGKVRVKPEFPYRPNYVIILDDGAEKADSPPPPPLSTPSRPHHQEL